MKYQTKITIHKPLKEVVDKFDDAEGIKHWMRGLTEFKTYQGEAGKAGAKSIVRFDTGKRKIEMTETIISNNLPSDITMAYDAPGVHNIVRSEFRSNGNDTEMIQHQEFQFQNLGMRIFGRLFPGMFKKQSQQYAQDFKAYVEEGKSVLD
jgi:uncharacterized membrane protein